MAVTIPTPDDATYDYVPTAGADIEVGMNIQSFWVVQGAIHTIVDVPDAPEEPNELWAWFLHAPNPDGTTSTGLAMFPESSEILPDQWYDRIAIWRRAAKLADGATLTAADGSKWIYDVGGDGRIVCYAAGSTYARGDLRFRGELTTNPKDLWICDDAEWDWLPITDGSEVTVGDTITFLWARGGVVDAITVIEENALYRRTSFTDEAGEPLGVWEERFAGAVLVANTWTWFRRIPKPVNDSMWSAADGSQWIYTDGVYFCWKPGTTYSTGVVFGRGTDLLTPV